MKDFTFWRGLITDAKTPKALKEAGENLNQYQNQTGLFGDEEKKLSEGQVAILRAMYSEKMKKVQVEKL
jgi:hypothetical protein